MAKAYYAVQKGTNPGVYLSWDEAKEQVTGFKGAVYKKFKTRDAASAFAFPNEIEPPSNDNTPPSLEVEVKTYQTRHDDAIIQSNKPRTVSVYADGSYREAGYYGGYLILKQGTVIKRDIVIGTNENYMKLRNVAGEIASVMSSIDFVHENYPSVETIHLYVDYIGLIHWPKSPADGGWKRNNELTQAYAQYVNKMQNHLNIKLHHVKGHNDDIYNEEVDALATFAATLHAEKRPYDDAEFLDFYHSS